MGPKSDLTQQVVICSHFIVHLSFKRDYPNILHLFIYGIFIIFCVRHLHLHGDLTLFFVFLLKSFTVLRVGWRPVIFWIPRLVL